MQFQPGSHHLSPKQQLSTLCLQKKSVFVHSVVVIPSYDFSHVPHPLGGPPPRLGITQGSDTMFPSNLAEDTLSLWVCCLMCLMCSQMRKW